jgi:NADP-dependent 3-hydroxy acid dehydrogenase YdfG
MEFKIDVSHGKGLFVRLIVGCVAEGAETHADDTQNEVSQEMLWTVGLNAIDAALRMSRERDSRLTVAASSTAATTPTHIAMPYCASTATIRSVVISTHAVLAIQEARRIAVSANFARPDSSSYSVGECQRHPGWD